MPQIAVFISLLFFASLGQAAELYYCRAYSGGTFWASSHCNNHQGLVERIVNVPDGMPFDQQVDLGRQRLVQKPRTIESNTTIVQNGPRPTRRQLCDGFKARVAHLDSLARQPQSAQMQDSIRAERKKVRDQQFRAQC